MKLWLSLASGVVLAFLLSITGCGTVNKDFTASTSASYTPGGPISYQSTKNQENFHAKVEVDADGKLKALDIQTTASTPEAAIAAALQSNIETQKQLGLILQTIVPLVTKAAGAAAGVPIP